MKQPLIRQGEGPAASILRHHQERTNEQQNLNKILAQADTNPDLNSRTITRATAGGDERKLRGIPAIGRGVAGAINNTSPHTIHWNC